MSSKDQTITPAEPFAPARLRGSQRGEMADAITIAWSYEERERIGEVAFLSHDPAGFMLGRGSGKPGKGKRVEFVRQRPGCEEAREPVNSQAISREQLRLVASEDGLAIEQCGRCPLIVKGKITDKALIKPGQTFLLRGQFLFVYARRPDWLPPLKFYPGPTRGRFGHPDTAGMVGEAPVVWKLRDELAFFAQSDRHVLVTGQSGTGKELAAQAIHLLSSRASKPMISRNAAALPSGLIDAELFGNAKNYPNPGMAERRGLIGEADGSTLFLDEIGEMPRESQVHLLRVLDSRGEYQRLGESQVRRSNFRLIAASNRNPTSLKHDFLSRLPCRAVIPPLQERRDDIPLLIRHVLRQLAQHHPHARAFFDGDDITHAQPLVAPELVEDLVLRNYTHHMRELEKLLLRAVMMSDGSYVAHPGALDPTDGDDCEDPGQDPADTDASAGDLERVGALSKVEIIDALERNAWVIRRAWHDLGLKSRYQLYRLMDKYGIQRRPRGGKG